MRVWNIVFLLICMAEFLYILRIRKQLAEWLVFLKNLHRTPERNFFVKGNDILADINFELNGILEESRRQFVKLQRAENANQQLLTDLSHDVRTPLASLIGYLESLDSGSAKEQEEYIHIAYRKALDLQELTDTLFQWFKLVSGEQRYQMKIYDINELTREIIIEHIPALEKLGISFYADIPDEEWFVKTDRMAYARIINNLLSNAIKHGKCSFIEVALSRDEYRVLVCISNNGNTIPESELPFIFERLYKGDCACTGNGLGLAIVRGLINAMSGEITVKSVPGERTAFCFALPFIVREK